MTHLNIVVHNPGNQSYSSETQQKIVQNINTLLSEVSVPEPEGFDITRYSTDVQGKYYSAKSYLRTSERYLQKALPKALNVTNYTGFPNAITSKPSAWSGYTLSAGVAAVASLAASALKTVKQKAYALVPSSKTDRVFKVTWFYGAKVATEYFEALMLSQEPHTLEDISMLVRIVSALPTEYTHKKGAKDEDARHWVQSHLRTVESEPIPFRCVFIDDNVMNVEIGWFAPQAPYKEHLLSKALSEPKLELNAIPVPAYTLLFGLYYNIDLDNIPETFLCKFSLQAADYSPTRKTDVLKLLPKTCVLTVHEGDSKRNVFQGELFLPDNPDEYLSHLHTAGWNATTFTNTPDIVEFTSHVTFANPDATPKAKKRALKLKSKNVAFKLAAQAELPKLSDCPPKLKQAVALYNAYFAENEAKQAVETSAFDMF